MVTISDALFTKTQQRVLGLLYGKPDKSFIPTKLYARQPWVGGTIRREPERLSSAGLLKVSREGNQQHYQANPASPVYQELFNIVKKHSALQISSTLR